MLAVRRGNSPIDTVNEALGFVCLRRGPVGKVDRNLRKGRSILEQGGVGFGEMYEMERPKFLRKKRKRGERE